MVALGARARGGFYSSRDSWSWCVSCGAGWAMQGLEKGVVDFRRTMDVDKEFHVLALERVPPLSSTVRAGGSQIAHTGPGAGMMVGRRRGLVSYWMSHIVRA